MTGLTGIVPILLTPFTETGAIDFDSLEREVDHVVASGVHGMGLAIGSEIFKLTRFERRALLSAVAQQLDERMPLVMNVSAPGTSVAAEFAADAAVDGASRLMVWPPDFFATGPDAVIEHLKAIAAASDLPIILQDVPQSPISPTLALRIADEVPQVDTIKVETQPNVGQVKAMKSVVGDRLAILGGAGGGTLVEEFMRGAQGTMPFASQSRDFMRVWKLLLNKDWSAASKVIEERILPVSRLGFQSADLFYHVHKDLLLHQGIFETAFVRSPTAMPDDMTLTEIKKMTARMFSEPNY